MSSGDGDGDTTRVNNKRPHDGGVDGDGDETMSDNNENVQEADDNVMETGSEDNTQTQVEKMKGIFNKHVDPHPLSDETRHAADVQANSQLLLDRLKTTLQNEWILVAEGTMSIVFAMKDKSKDWKTVATEMYNDCVIEGLAPKEDSDLKRLASITKDLGRTYRGKFDLEQFKKKIDHTFDWYVKDHKTYLSPSFAMIQSSGTGKTRLMMEYKKQQNEHADDVLKSGSDMSKEDVTSNASPIRVVTVLCTNSGTPTDWAEYFDEVLVLPLNEEALRTQLDVLLKKFQEGKVVLMFDEAQMLVRDKEGRLYHTVRWWLRETRSEKQVVAVFAGTLLSLSNYQQTRPPTNFSRDDDRQYLNYNEETADEGKKLYDPFYIITTMAMDYPSEDKYNDELFDIRKCGRFGRPLFAAMLKVDNKEEEKVPELALKKSDVCVDGDRVTITNSKLHSILNRMVLSEKNKYAIHQNSIASILATRVQMGIASYNFASEVTSKGYANLVDFHSGNQHRSHTASAGIVFPPDPVCAALAMGLMQETWSIKNGGSNAFITGKEPSFWVMKASEMFGNQMFKPNRGDPGEVFAALYMLLCGDNLRSEKDKGMRKFSVDLNAWLEELDKSVQPIEDSKPATAQPTEDSKPATAPPRRSPRLAVNNNSQTTNKSSVCDTGLSLNFIQVCRNHFRTHAWFSQAALKFMYDTAVACYVFNNCPAIDLVFPIFISETKSFHPALVSVKCWDTIGTVDMQNAVNAMKAYLQYRTDDESKTKALCILIVIGARNVGDVPPNEGSFPKEDSFVIKVVPRSDKYGVHTAIEERTVTSFQAEMLASHAFAQVEVKRFDALRAVLNAKERVFGYDLLEEKQGDN